MLYPYIRENNLEQTQNYRYSEYAGEGFLKIYIETRKQYISNHTTAKKIHVESSGDPLSGGSDTYRKLMKMKDCLKKDGLNEDNKQLLEQFVKTFEVRKRLYDEYQEGTWKPSVRAGYSDEKLYLLFAHILIEGYQQTGSLKYFNTLLKLDDTLLSISEGMQEREAEELSWILCRELLFFMELVKCNGCGGLWYDIR